MKITNKHVGAAILIIPVALAVCYGVYFSYVCLVQHGSECAADHRVVVGGFVMMAMILFTVQLGVLTAMLLEDDIKFEIDVPIFADESEDMKEFNQWIKEKDEKLN